MCVYCDDRGKQFQSLEAVRKHMEGKSHCKLHYGDDGAVEEELEEFYDFSNRCTVLLQTYL
jgi:pre-60S factor REI1